MPKESKLLSFLYLTERLKIELRHSWMSNGREESVAEHSWRLSLMVMLCHPYLDQKVDIEKSLKMAIIHDIAEVITGDIPYFQVPEGSKEKKQKILEERKAIQKIKEELGSFVGEEIEDLWEEYEQNETYEAKFVKALDKLEAQMQRNQAPLETWNDQERQDLPGRLNQFCDFDSFLGKLKEAVQEQCLKKIKTEVLSISRTDL